MTLFLPIFFLFAWLCIACLCKIAVGRFQFAISRMVDLCSVRPYDVLQRHVVIALLFRVPVNFCNTSLNSCSFQDVGLADEASKACEGAKSTEGLGEGPYFGAVGA